MIIVASTNHTLVVLSENTRYEYVVNTYNQKLVARFLKQGFTGKAWQLLKKFPLYSKE